MAATIFCGLPACRHPGLYVTSGAAWQGSINILLGLSMTPASSTEGSATTSASAHSHAHTLPSMQLLQSELTLTPASLHYVMQASEGRPDAAAVLLRLAWRVGSEARGGTRRPPLKALVRCVPGGAARWRCSVHAARACRTADGGGRWWAAARHQGEEAMPCHVICLPGFVSLTAPRMGLRCMKSGRKADLILTLPAVSLGAGAGVKAAPSAGPWRRPAGARWRAWCRPSHAQPQLGRRHAACGAV